MVILLFYIKYILTLTDWTCLLFEIFLAEVIGWPQWDILIVSMRFFWMTVECFCCSSSSGTRSTLLGKITGSWENLSGDLSQSQDTDQYFKFYRLSHENIKKFPKVSYALYGTPVQNSSSPKKSWLAHFSVVSHLYIPYY